MSITTTFRNTSQITIDEISEMFPKQGRFNTELNELRAAKVERDETIKRVEIPQSLMPMLCEYKSIRPPKSHVCAFEFSGTVKLVAQLEARIELLQRVALHTVFYLDGDNTDADGYELHEALEAAGYGVIEPFGHEQSAQPEGGE